MATVAILVMAAGDAPIAADDNATTPEDTPITVAVLANDSDPDGDALIVTSVTTPTHGAAVLNPDNTITYTPDANYNGIGGLPPDSFSYTISDGQGGSATATVTITVTPVNDGPTAADDAATTPEDTPATIDVLVNDSDVDGDTLTVTSLTQPTHGVANNNGTDVTYTPDADYYGPDSFTYTVTDGQGGSATATVTITVTPVNDNPIAVDDSAATPEDTPVTLDVLANDGDVDGDALTVTAVSTATHGLVTLNPDSSVTYTPDPDYHGTDSFSYTISDGHGGSDTATVSITVTPVNDFPLAVDDSAATPEDTPVTIDVLANDSDVDGDPLTVASVTQPAHGVVVNNGGDVAYTPAADFHGSDSFTYTTSDGNGGSATAAVAVTVTPVNDAPLAVDDTAAIAEDTAITIDVLANDSDVDGDTLTISNVSQPANGVVVNNGSDVTYTPAAGFNGSDSFTYTVSDGHGGSDLASVTITVTPTNDPPLAVNDTAATSEDTPVTIDVLANDSDVDGDALSISAVTQPTNGVVVNNGSDVTYTPDENFNGSDSFTYTVSDGNGGSDTATVIVTVTPVNDAPLAVDDAADTLEDTPVTIDVLANDSDVDGDTLSVATVDQPGNGTVVINPDNTITYTPDQDFNSTDSFDGTDSFNYTASDGHGGSATATVTVTVIPVNDAPAAVDDVAATPEDIPVTIDVLANDSDVENDPLLVTAVTAPLHGSAVVNPDNTITYTPDANTNGLDSFSYTVSDGNGGFDTAVVALTVTPVNDAPLAANDEESTLEDTPVTVDVLSNDSDVDGDALTVSAVTTPTHGVVVINPDGTVTYTPDANYNGIGGLPPDSFSYTVNDGYGGAATAGVNITVLAVNDNPAAVNDDVVTAEDTPIAIDVLANDSDVDGDTLVVSDVTQPTHGTVVNNGVDLLYTPDENYNGVDSFAYTVSDGNAGSDTATVSITITPVNDAPTAVDDSAATPEDMPVTIGLLVNDDDVDGDALTVSSVTTPTHGSLLINPDNTVTYTPDANYNGGDSFSYTLSDGQGGGDTASVTVAVTPVNDDPVANADAIATTEDTPVTVDVLANDSDVDGDALTVTAVSTPTHGSVQINPDNTVTYTPAFGFNGVDSFVYTISDGSGGLDTAMVTVTVTAENDNPVAADDSATTPEDTPVTIDVLANDADGDADPLTINSVTQPAHGTVVNHGVNVTYTPDANYFGADSFSYTVSDGQGGSDTASVSVTVTPVNDAPAVIDDVAMTMEDMSVTVDVLANDSDVEGDILSVTAVTQPSHGAVVVNPDNTVTYTPNLNFHGADSFTYTVSDGQGGSDTASVTVTVTPVNDAPVAVGDNAVTLEDTPVTIDALANDSDVDGDALSVTAVTTPTNGSVVVNPNGTLTYTPDANFYGGDSFAYTVSDGSGGSDMASVTITVSPVNDNPAAVDDAATMPEDTSVTVNVLANDGDVDGDTLMVAGVSAPAHGSVVVNGDNTVTYTPDVNYYGPDSFDYTVEDGQGGADWRLADSYDGYHSHKWHIDHQS